MRSSNCYENINEVNALNRKHKIDVGKITHKDRNQNRSPWFTVHLDKPDKKRSTQTLWNWLISAPRYSLPMLESHVALRSMLKARFLAFDLVIIAGTRKKTLVLLLVRTVCAAKYSTKIHHIAKNSRINSRQFKKYTTCLQLLLLQFARSHAVTSHLKWSVEMKILGFQLTS